MFRKLRRAALAALTLAVAGIASAAPAYAWWDNAWSYRTRININTAESGAAIASPIGRAQVLVRLHAGNFNFADAKSDGSDLRFVAGDDSTPLRFHIERFDAAEQVALVWVDVVNIAPNVSAPIYVYYGNGAANTGVNARGTYAPDQVLVYHFAEAGAPRDATANGVNAETEAPRDANGLIGQALQLDGQNAIRLPASPALAFTAGQTLTVSAWVKPSANANGALYTAPGALTIGFANGAPYAESGAVRASATQALAADAWAHVALVADGTNLILYVNGVRAGEAAGALPAFQGVSTIGQGFTGGVDEFQIAKGARSDGQIALAAHSQGLRANLLTFDTAEQSGGGHDYLNVLFSALTFDALIVIAILGVMFIIAVVVMVTKALAINGTAAANEEFLAAYEDAASKRARHEGLPAPEGAMSNSKASLARLYQLALRELDIRVRENGQTGGGFALAPQSIEAIRAKLDAGAVRERETLSKYMVLLTISIAGAPFIGLFGTLLGIMITFANVAASGDANIAAIAPGMAAALLATAAGIGVAIPALFGYNYLQSRAKSISNETAIFVDELVTRIAEIYRGSSTSRAA